MMQRFAVSLVLLLVPLLTTEPAIGLGVPYRVASPCPRAHSRVLLADAQAEIYTVRESFFTAFEGGAGEAQRVIATRGCVYGRKHSYKINEEYVPQPTEVDSGIANLALSGMTVAYEESYYGGSRYTEEQENLEEWRVVVRDLRTGRALHEVPTGMKSPAHPKFVGDGPTTAIVVKSDGAVAWILAAVQEHATYQVHALDKTGNHVLATGSDIAPHSLAVAGNTLYWTQGGKPTSAALH
jgi:hypothetical protein